MLFQKILTALVSKARNVLQIYKMFLFIAKEKFAAIYCISTLLSFLRLQT
jgi:hypothetical protein